MASIRFENGSRIDLYVGETVYRDIQVVSMNENVASMGTIVNGKPIAYKRKKPETNKEAVKYLDKDY
jgi:hypothetical protein